MKQLHNVAEKYRVMKKYNVKLSKWGLSLGLRIPKELAKKYKFRDNKEVTIIPEDKGIKIVPS
jgi:antitoxin component of MazEF toxin-antitoxin module